MEEIAKALVNKVRGNPTLKQLKDMILKWDKYLIEQWLGNEERHLLIGNEVTTKPLTYTQAIFRQDMKDAEKQGKTQKIFWLDDFLDLENGELFRVSEKQHRELSEIMSLTLRKNPKLKTYEGKLIFIIFF